MFNGGALSFERGGDKHLVDAGKQGFKGCKGILLGRCSVSCCLYILFAAILSPRLSKSQKEKVITKMEQKAELLQTMAILEMSLLWGL